MLPSDKPFTRQRYYTAQQVARRLGVSASTVYRDAEEGRIEAHCFGVRNVRFSEEAVLEYEAKCRRTLEAGARDLRSA